LWIAFNLWFDDLWHTSVRIHSTDGWLWIAFNLWFDDLWHTWRAALMCHTSVVNCFQFVIWRSLTHLFLNSSASPPGCELLSICDLTIFDTPISLNWCSTYSLWIAFNLWFDDLWHTQKQTCQNTDPVVNCFQFVIWRSLTHLRCRSEFFARCCELLSICDLTIFDTPPSTKTKPMALLWIAFNLWFDDLWHTTELTGLIGFRVVNCFQFVIWRSLTHRIELCINIRRCCELLSICDLTIFDTPSLCRP